jgi:hypothetical protein
LWMWLTVDDRPVEAAQVSERPIVASQTGAWEVYNHILSKPDDDIQKILGGILCECLKPTGRLKDNVDI